MDAEIVKSRKKRLVKYLVVLVILVGLSVGGYYLYGYYNEQFIEQRVVAAVFSPSITEDEAVATLSKYDEKIATRTPREYDDKEWAPLQNFSKYHIIEFHVAGARKQSLIKQQLKKEVGILKVL